MHKFLITIFIFSSFSALAQQVVYKKAPAIKKNIFRLVLIERNKHYPHVGSLVAFSRSGTLNEVRETKPFRHNSRDVFDCRKVETPSRPQYSLHIIAQDFDQNFRITEGTCKSARKCLEKLDVTETIDVKLNDDLKSIDEVVLPEQCKPLG